MKSIRFVLLALALLALPALGATVTITAPTVEFLCNADTSPGGTNYSYAAYPHKVITVVDGVAICFRCFWLGTTATVGGSAVYQGILEQGDGDTDGMTLYISQSAPSGGVVQQMVLSLTGVTTVYKAGGTWRLPVGAWTTVIISRESTTWKCRIAGVDQNPDHNQTSAPGATTTDKFEIGNDPNSLGLANFNGLISDIAIFQGVAGAAPLSSQNKTDIETSFANALTITPASGTLVQYSHLTGDSSTDTAGGSDAYTLSYTNVLAVTAPASSGTATNVGGTVGGRRR